MFVSENRPCMLCYQNNALKKRPTLGHGHLIKLEPIGSGGQSRMQVSFSTKNTSSLRAMIILDNEIQDKRQKEEYFMRF